jgi:hypothetical protein
MWLFWAMTITSVPELLHLAQAGATRIWLSVSWNSLDFSSNSTYDVAGFLTSAVDSLRCSAMANDALVDLLLRYEELLQQGQSPTPEEMCREHRTG